MTATAPMTAPSLQQLAPNVAARVKEGDLGKAQAILLGAGVVLIGAAWATGGSHFYFSYLVGYMGVLGIALGALFFVMLQHITRAGWSVTVRRLAENIMATLRNRREQLLRAAFLTAARSDATVVNYLARRLVESQGKPPSLAPTGPTPAR